MAEEGSETLWTLTERCGLFRTGLGEMGALERLEFSGPRELHKGGQS